MIYQFLENGLEVAIKENHFSKMVAIQVWVHAGSIHERESERGMAHLIEHMLFKGTERRAVGEISAEVERLGGDMNAYTTFDRTVYYITLPAEHARVAMDLLSDAVFNSAFDPVELDREKEVVIEEIRRGLDSPGNVIGRKLFELSYPHCEVGRPIIGYEPQVKDFTRDILLGYYRRWYVPSNMSVVICGAVDGPQAFGWVKELFSKASPPERPSRAPLDDRFCEGISCEVIKGDYEQPRLEMAFRSPALADADSVPLDLAAFALGAGESSRLSRRLRDEEGLVSAVGCSAYTPQCRGVFFLSAYPRPETMLSTASALGREICSLKYSQPVIELELARARANVRADRVHQEETVGGMARTLGFALTTPSKLYFDDVALEMVNKTTPAHVHSAVNRWIDEQNAVLVALLPKESSLTAEELKAAYLQGVKAASPTKGGTGQVLRVATNKPQNLLPVRVEIRPGLTLAYRENPDTPMVSLVAATEGGLRGETDENAGIYHAFAGMLGKASRDFDYDDILERTEGCGASLDGFSGKDSFGMRMQSLSEFTEGMLETFFSCLFRPVFPEQQWQTVRREIQHSLTSQNDSPSSICFRTFQERLYGGHPYSHPMYGTARSIETFNCESLLNFYESNRDGGPWSLGAVGPWSAATFLSMLQRHIANWQPAAQKRRFTQAESQLKVQVGETVHITKSREQTHICLGYRGLSWEDPMRAALDVMSSVMGGNGGRLFSKLRDEMSLAYTVAPVMSFGQHPGTAASYIACAPGKAKLAIGELDRELRELTMQPPTAAEVERAINYIVGNHEVELQRGETQAMTMALMEVYGIGFDDFLKYPGRVKSVTAEQVQAVAQRLFVPGTKITVSVGPELSD